MRLNLNLRGVDLIDVEFHVGSKGLYLDVNVFQPQGHGDDEKVETTADLTGTSSGSFERVEGPVWGEDQPALVRSVPLGFQARGA